MINVVGVKTRVGDETRGLDQICGLPLNCWNIQNINNYKKYIYKKQIDNKHHSITPDRNTVERTGTTFQMLFQMCSGKPNLANTTQTLVDQGLQRFRQKTCSAVFRLRSQNSLPPESHVFRGLAGICAFLFRMFRHVKGYTPLFDFSA